jgi:hypothetical protein
MTDDSSSSDSNNSSNSNNELWLTFLQALTSNLYNYSQSRRYPPLLSKRQEAFTESWPTAADAAGCHNNNSSNSFRIADDASLLLATEHPSLLSSEPEQQPFFLLKLVQFEPAWEEQLALHLAKIPFVVVNSSFACMEATGPLPCLYDLRRGGVPCMVGRYSKSSGGSGSNNSSIVQYIMADNSDNNNSHLPPESSKSHSSSSSLAKLLERMIVNDLRTSLTVLKYQQYPHWHQVYRSQYQQAAASGNNSAGWWWASLQTFSVRLWHRYQVSRLELTTAQAIQQAQTVFRVLEEHLQQIITTNAESTSSSSSSSQGYHYLLGTETPTLVDVFLWGCLADALTNVHLVVVLADFPQLCAYAQRIWDTYFDSSSLINNNNNNNATTEWQQWNAQENARNVFCQLPLVQDKKHVSEYKHALELMEQLSLQGHNLHKHLLLAKDLRRMHDQSVPNQPYYYHQPWHTWHRWRMGGDWYPSQSAASSSKEGPTEEAEKSKREYKRNDDVWMATATFSILASVLLFGFRRSE